MPDSRIYPVTPYRPDGGVEAAGLLMLVGASVVVGGAVALAAHLLSQYVWVVVAFPAGMGALLGGAALYCIGRGRVRSPLIAGGVTLAAGVGMMALMHHFDYQSFQRQRAEVPGWESYQHLSPEQREAMLQRAEQGRDLATPPDEARRREAAFLDGLAVDGFGPYLAWSAAQGVEISGNGGGGGAPITGVFVYLYWLFEAAIAAGIALVIAHGRARQPYARAAGAWKEPSRLGTLSGRDRDRAIRAINGGDPTALAACVATRGPAAVPGGGGLILTVFASPDAGSVGSADPTDGVDLKLEGPGKAGGTREVAMATWPAESLPALRDLFAPPPPRAAAKVNAESM